MPANHSPGDALGPFERRRLQELKRRLELGGSDPEVLLSRQRDGATDRVLWLERQVRDLADEQALTTHDDEHDPEGVTIGYQRAQSQSLLAGARADLATIEQARQRICDGTYGSCARCGVPIGADRLAALPAALTCIDCARRTRPGRPW